MTARPLPWPMPVKASEPCRLAVSAAGRALAARGQLPSASSSRKRLAAVIGPIVWELDGPMPILKTSKMERNSKRRPRPIGFEVAGRA